MQHHYPWSRRVTSRLMRSAKTVGCAMMLLLPALAQAQNTAGKSVSLTFSGANTATITGNVPTGVTVNVASSDGVDVSGVTATLAKVSFTAFQTQNACSSGTLLGPASGAGYDNSNGSTIEYTFCINGLNSALPQFNEVDLGVSGINVSGSYQNSNNEDRPFLFDVACGQTDATDYHFPQVSGDLMRNAFNDGRNYKSIPLTNTAALATTEPVYLKVTLTHNGTLGCYAALSDIVVKYVESDTTVTPEPNPEPGDTTVTPDPEPQPQPGDTTGYLSGKYYKIYLYKNHNEFMGADAGGNLVVLADEPTNRIWWVFEPATKDSCFYIKNATTGQYIQALTGKGANSFITLGDQKVEYYVGRNNVAGSSTNGYWWFCSTNNAGYNVQSNNTLALNRDGGNSDKVLTWVTTGNNGSPDPNSYWFIQESTYDYDPTPFVPSDGERLYFIKSSATSKTLADNDGKRVWTDQAMDKSHQWYFTGVSNRAGGYQIVSAATRQAIDTLHYVVELAQSGYTFRHACTPATALNIEGDTAFYFEEARSAFSLAAQIYNMPCGTLGQPRVKSATLKGDGVRTPLTVTDNEISPRTANTVWTKSRAVVVAGSKGTLNLTLSQAPSADVEGWLYFDWDRDGFFEQSVKLDVAQNITQEITFPAIGEGSTAKAGQTHMRLRLTSTGLSGAEDDVIGQSVDFIVSLTADNSAFKATARPNDPERGTTVVDGLTATATPTGNSTFVCWKEQNKVVSTDASYTFTLDHDVDLVAVFAPATDYASGISSVSGKSDKSIVLSVDGKTVTATAPTAVKAIHVFTPNGALVASSKGAKVALPAKAGVYIAKARTANGEASLKFHVAHKH